MAQARVVRVVWCMVAVGSVVVASVARRPRMITVIDELLVAALELRRLGSVLLDLLLLPERLIHLVLDELLHLAAQLLGQVVQLDGHLVAAAVVEQHLMVVRLQLLDARGDARLLSNGARGRLRLWLLDDLLFFFFDALARRIGLGREALGCAAGAGTSVDVINVLHLLNSSLDQLPLEPGLDVVDELGGGRRYSTHAVRAEFLVAHDGRKPLESFRWAFMWSLADGIVKGALLLHQSQKVLPLVALVDGLAENVQDGDGQSDDQSRRILLVLHLGEVVGVDRIDAIAEFYSALLLLLTQLLNRVHN